jgi:hypothetical protein
MTAEATRRGFTAAAIAVGGLCVLLIAVAWVSPICPVLLIGCALVNSGTVTGIAQFWAIPELRPGRWREGCA